VPRAELVFLCPYILTLRLPFVKRYKFRGTLSFIYLVKLVIQLYQLFLGKVDVHHSEHARKAQNRKGSKHL